MKVVFAALNARHSHTNLAVRLVAGYVREQGIPGCDVEIWERTINHRRHRLLQELGERQADVVVFSCYIWNSALVRSLASDLRTVCPQTVLVAAGPEVSFHPQRFLEETPAFDLVLAGEGEAITTSLLRELEALPPTERRRAAAGRVLRAEMPVAMDALPFPYADLEALTGRTMYYESMRGCPFRCSYCLSAVEGGAVRFRDLALVFADLRRFLQAGVRQVKFVDRTFNCNQRRARAIWRWLAEQDNGLTGFHFELSGELLDEESLALLATLRPGLVQFEIGVQSTNPQTLQAIRRPADLQTLFAGVRRLRAPGNIHLHLDLIAGLPQEDYDSFARSFNEVYAYRPHQLQLGFLKVLQGTPIEAEAEGYGIRYSAEPPWEVLRTRWLSFRELSALHRVEEMVDTYYNSGRFTHLLREMEAAFATPFAFYQALGDYYFACGWADAPPSKRGYYEVLGDFLQARGIAITQRHQWLCRYDLALHEKPRQIPAWVMVDGAGPHRERILNFYSQEENLRRFLPALLGQPAKQIWRRAHLEEFPFDPEIPEIGAPGACALLFDYSRRDITGRARVQRVKLEMPDGM